MRLSSSTQGPTRRPSTVSVAAGQAVVALAAGAAVAEVAAVAGVGKSLAFAPDEWAVWVIFNIP